MFGLFVDFRELDERALGNSTNSMNSKNSIN
jgi:hypothetical protein